MSDVSGMITELGQCVGSEYNFYGVDNLMFKLDDMVFEAVEDENDGYRSMLGTIIRRENELRDEHGVQPIFWKGNAVARVRVEAMKDLYEVHEDYGRTYRAFDGYFLRDVTSDHVWLAVGTNDSDNYYPSFTFIYTPVWDAVIEKLRK